jgi:hypothetical protein
MNDPWNKPQRHEGHKEDRMQGMAKKGHGSNQGNTLHSKVPSVLPANLFQLES